ncbi:MAG TPA: GNVR domain-containing protein [Bryobacteraceae bacterium]|nr:GNVR domain-containing protein [Bryobacteraceae bacterium]
MLDRLSVPRRPLDFEDYIDILRRNVGWLIAPAFLGLVVSLVVAYSMEDTYVSQALIRIVPQQISEKLVQSYTAQDIADRINSMAQSIQSRNVLTNLINTYGLYKAELKKEPLTDVIDKMKDAMAIYPVPGVTNVAGASLPAMGVSFKYRDPDTAQKVCQELVSRFLNVSTQDTLENQMLTNKFLEDEVTSAKRDLEIAEQKLADYRTKNAGRLPDETAINLQQMNALEQRYGSLSEAMSRNSEQKMMLEDELRMANDRMAAVKAASPEIVAYNQRISQLDKDIETAKNNVAELKQRYHEDYPGLQDAEQQVSFLEKQRADLAKSKPTKTDASVDDPSIAGARLDGKEQIDRIKTQLKANSMEAQRIMKEMAGVNAAIKSYQARLESGPTSEKEYVDLMRDRELAKQQYEDLELKRQKSELSMNLERRKQGESLELLDPATKPDTPSAPKRAKIIPIGAFAGLALGLVIVAIREVKDTSLKNLKDARLYTQLQILGSIPLLENDVVVQRRKQVMWVSWATATVLGIAIMAGSVAHYYLSKA